MAKRTARRPGDPEPPLDAAATRRVLAALATHHPNADTELHFSTPYQLLVATILSAQCTDARVNQVTPALFRRYPDAAALARATTAALEPQIVTTGFFRAKSKALLGMAAALVGTHGGEVPASMEALVALPGVGRKTANVVLGHALGIPGLPVDRHVLRVANRLGIAASDDPEVVERQLGAALPPAEWTRASDTLILHGRRICKPKPLCNRCAAAGDCLYFRHVVSVDQERGDPVEPSASRRKPRAAAPAAKMAPVTKPRRAGGGRKAPRSARPESGQSPVPTRAAEPRGTGRGGGPSDRVDTESGKSLQPRRAAKPRGTGGGRKAPRSAAPESGQSPVATRAAKPRGTARGGTAPRSAAPESGQSPVPTRAAEPRGTGRGGGAPRQTKK